MKMGKTDFGKTNRQKEKGPVNNVYGIDYWFAPGTQLHLHVPGGYREWGSVCGGVFKVHSGGQPLQREGT